MTASTHYLEELQALTREYSRYSRSAGGLSAVFGGVACLLSYLFGAMLPPTPALRIFLLAMPLLWLLSKQAGTQLYQRRYGSVQELEDTQRGGLQRRLVLAISLLCVAVVLGPLVGNNSQILAWTPAALLHAVIVIAIPFVAWRFLHTPLDLAIGVFLLCQAALVALGATYSLWSAAIVFVPAAALMIAIGIRDHLRFRAIERRIQDIVASAGSAR